MESNHRDGPMSHKHSLNDFLKRNQFSMKFPNLHMYSMSHECKVQPYVHVPCTQCKHRQTDGQTVKISLSNLSACICTTVIVIV